MESEERFRLWGLLESSFPQGGCSGPSENSMSETEHRTLDMPQTG